MIISQASSIVMRSLRRTLTPIVRYQARMYSSQLPKGRDFERLYYIGVRGCTIAGSCMGAYTGIQEYDSSLRGTKSERAFKNTVQVIGGGIVGAIGGFWVGISWPVLTLLFTGFYITDSVRSTPR